MRILVLNGSPKGAQSVTMMHVHYLQKSFPQHTFEFQHLSQRIKRLESNAEAFEEVLGAVREADALLWATPVYYFTVPGQYKRFFELVFERGAGAAFADKYTAALTTSIHFFDHTSVNYLRAVCEDLGMKFMGAYPAHMQEMMTEQGRQRLRSFGEQFLMAVEGAKPVQPQFASLQHHTIAYKAGNPLRKTHAGDRKVLVIHDALPEDGNLREMVAHFTACFEGPVEVANLREVDIKGGCLGCLHCGYDNICSYGDKDGFVRFYDETVRKADLLVFAGRIHDRYLSSRWKTYFDRSFFRGHAPSLIGKQIAFLVSGPLRQNANLQQVLQAYPMMQRANLAGMVSDEVTTAEELDALLGDLAEHMVKCAKDGYFQPDNFLFVGGKKLFRDDIFGGLRAVFLADYRMYRKLGYFDFPTRNWRERLLNAGASLAFRIPAIRGGFQRMIKQGMIRGHQKVLEKE